VIDDERRRRTGAAVGADALTERGAGLEVAVVGAGGIGATAAYDLACEGATVTLYDRGSVASGATGRAAGICYDAFADGLDAEIAGDAIERFRAFSSDDTFSFVECPYVWLAREGDGQRADAIRDQVRRMQDNGIVALEIDGDALAERFPALRTDDVAVAGIAGGAGYVDPTAYTACLAAAATGAGATLETETTVDVRTDPTRVVRPDGEVHEVDAVLVAAGARTKGCSQMRVSPSQSSRTACRRWSRPPTSRNRCVTTRPAASTCDPTRPASSRATGPKTARPIPTRTSETPIPRSQTGYSSGSAIACRASRTAITDSSERGLASVRRRPTGIRSSDASATGCTSRPDSQGHGFMRAPAIGERLAEEILDGGRIDAFDPTRFRGDGRSMSLKGWRSTRTETVRCHCVPAYPHGGSQMCQN